MAATSSLALALIAGYRRYLSPYKGFRCAAGALCGRSCSDQGLRIFQRCGLFTGLALLQRQFDRCALAAEALRLERTARRPFGPRSQQGFCDVGDCDCSPGPGLDCTDCAPDADCCDGSRSSGSGCRRAIGECLTCDACCDADWGRRRSGSDTGRADKARRRQEERQARRDARRQAGSARAEQQHTPE